MPTTFPNRQTACSRTVENCKGETGTVAPSSQLGGGGGLTLRAEHAN